MCFVLNNLIEKGVLSDHPCRREFILPVEIVSIEFWSHANLKYHIDVFMRREIIVPVEIVIRFEEIKSLIFTG